MSDMESLEETIGFISEALIFENGFLVSDNDHAKEILAWLVELQDRRGPVQ